jgi:tetratricopeptide (TPR) repeat protein
MGTVSYMSPEQAAGARVNASSDWYSVGAMLYEVLTGHPPFTGPSEQILERKQTEDATPPAAHAEVPADLDRLCVELLVRDPEARPSGAKILEVLTPGGSVEEHPPAQRARDSTPFIGRDRELSKLTASLGRIDQGPLIVSIEGESGVGKTALIREFLAQMRRTEKEPSLVLSGRCSERELVPFKAFDTIAEGITEHVHSLGSRITEGDGNPSRVARAMSEAALAFPVFNQIVPSSGDSRSHIRADPLAKRHFAFRGIRELLSALAAQSRVVLCIDDWQWADADSLALLSAILAPPEAPPILVLLIRRSDEQPLELSCPVERLELGNLNAPDAQELARRLLSDAGQTTESAELAVEGIAAESTGHPLFIAELVRQVIASGPTQQRTPRLDDALWSRFSALEPTVRRAAELLATARSPLPLSVLCEAMAAAHQPLAWADLPALMAKLREENLARSDGLRRSDRVDCFHDRVAFAISSHLAEWEQRLCHQALADAFEQTGSLDFESLMVHCRAAGDPNRAARYALMAADRAMDALGFERAAQLYRLYLELPAEERDLALVHQKLGEALSNLGRGREAADAYLAAVASGSTDRHVELSRLAADQLFRSGYVDDAVALIEQVFKTLGLSFPKSPQQALLWLASRRLQLRVRGIGFRRRNSNAIPPIALARVDASWSVAIGLSTVDNLRGAYLQSRHLLMALELGEPFRVLRAIATEAGYRATAGVSANRSVDQLLDAADALARDLGDPYAFGFTHLARGMGMFLRGDWTEARLACIAAESIFEGRPVMASWELATARMFSLYSHFYLGDLATIRKRVPELVREAEGRGDLYAATSLRLSLCNLAWLLADQPNEARLHLIEADDRWSHQGVHLQHYWSMVAWVNLELYDANPMLAYERVIRGLPLLKRSLLLRIEAVRIETAWLRARAAIALAKEDATRREELLRDAERCGRRLVREKLEWAQAVGHVALAGVFSVRGDDVESRTRLREGARLADHCGLRTVAMAARRCMGELETDGPNSASVGAIARPDRWAAVMTPGLSAVDG